MLWIGVLLPHFPVDLLESARTTCLAVTEGTGPHRRLLACSAIARRAGLIAGMGVPAALMREPSLHLIERSRAAERRALEALACWAHQFTSEVCLDGARWMLWLEVGSSLRYFRGLHALYTRIRDELTHLGYESSMGVACTVEGAAVLARTGSLPALNPPALRRTLAPLPLASLAIEAAVIDQLQTAGLQTIADVLAIDPPLLARRFGAQLPLYLQRLVGERADPRRRHRIPDRYRRQCDFLEPLEVLEGLLFPLRRLLQELQGYLRGRDAAIQHLVIDLQHRGDLVTELRLVTSAPQREAARLFALLREKLERTILPAAVTGVLLAVNELVAPQILQGDLFDDDQRRQETWGALLDKLRARLGVDAIRQLGLQDDHRPEHAWCLTAVQDGGRPGCAEGSAPSPDRPLWLLQPTPLTCLPPLLGTPERIEAGWWEARDDSRDYYLARTAEGSRWWLYREAATGGWFLQGLWA